MIQSPKRWLVAALLVGVGILSWIWPDGKSISVVPVEPPVPVRTKASQPDFQQERESSDAAAKRRIIEDWNALVKLLESEPPPSADDIQERLLATRVGWTELDPQVLAEMIRELLNSGADRATGLSFKIGPHGFLSGWPTLRVFLLDVLAASDPPMAAAIAKGLISETTSADEFVVALRSLTREGKGQAKSEELTAYFVEMLDRPEWENSAGFAEGLDLARFLGTLEAVQVLAEWEGNQALRSMALDEFAAEHPGVALGLADVVGGMARANLMARIHPDDPLQMAAVDAYLHRPELTDEEADAFLKSFPLRSATTGYRLYGKTPAPYTYEKVAAGDRAALERVGQWLQDPSLSKYQAGLGSLQKRLAAWTEQAR